MSNLMKPKQVLWAVSLLLAIAPATLHAASAAATVASVNGNVYIVSASGKSERVTKGQLIPVGSSIHTNSDSSVNLKLVPGAETIVSPGTDVTISQLEYKASGIKTRTVKLDLHTGTLICSLVKHDGHSQFLVNTPDGQTRAVGTTWTVTFSPSSGVTVQTVDGVVEIILPGGKTINVPGGKFTTSPDGTKTVVGDLTPQEIQDIKTQLGGTGDGGGTFTISPTDPLNQTSNPANISTNSTISPTE